MSPVYNGQLASTPPATQHPLPAKDSQRDFMPSTECPHLAWNEQTTPVVDGPLLLLPPVNRLHLLPPMII